jgi:hypothetical protein
MEFNGALCRGLKTVRYREKSASDADLTLTDFLADGGAHCREGAPPAPN